MCNICFNAPARVKGAQKKKSNRKNVQRSAHAVGLAVSESHREQRTQFHLYQNGLTTSSARRPRSLDFGEEGGLVEPLDHAHRPHQGDRVTASMSTSGVLQTQRQSSDPSFGAKLANKTFSRTLETESHNRDRKFTQLLVFLTPVYLLPFVFGSKEGVSIYCVLVTLVCLTGGLLPPVVAAILPLVILPVAGILPADQLAAEFLGPRVLAAWLLFAIAIACDETTVVARACLYALRQFALRVQPLFLSLQLLVLALSLFLPSWFVVVLGTVFIERFVAVVQREIVAFDQKSGLRVPTSISTQNFLEDIRRQRGQDRVATGGGSRKARRVSLITDTDMASDASRSNSLVHQYKLHPELLKERAFDAQFKARPPSLAKCHIVYLRICHACCLD
ncbi:hypothetical protein HPB51_005535 [Rhipicephalus microplus]|uniref:Uncharacterized protein n=1 Tax=Rhipicephalus microplus TaxID=6941 RepID=A0A9J6EYD4_RHIMP|nr:hypothetical protein HPB51_005535 [Rhipicephalus microplus]